MRELTVTASSRLVAGGLLWASLSQIFVVNYLVVLPRASNHSLVDEVISALGVTRCDVIEGLWFCSPWHEAADTAWIVGGVCLFLGAALNVVLFAPDRMRNAAFSLLVVSGVALVLTGLAPYNVHRGPHLIAAAVCFYSGAAGVLLLGVMLRQARRPCWGTFGIVCGTTSLVFATVTALRPDPGVQGVFERASAWPSVVWAILFGAHLAVTALRARRCGG
ncbi:DUF998 domain-containing protein [Streptomyces sp. WAC06614]|uniref:DUF998 domain-containing protein n=1 Tax=Streptomyces sp. WAC06614 TaxID=2487416 RepID=UPI000F797DC7|nr:DUF998 domain-containing protein [Streptomyces sp. WAC06614]RSS78652.1 DUF998 domain-containing protein [Streptomyces sp. WAC06614]